MNHSITIRRAGPEDDAAKAALLAPAYGTDAATLTREAAEIRSRWRDFGDLAPGLIAWVAVDENARVVGAAEATIRLFANGCESLRVLFLEGIAVDPARRGSGTAAALMAVIEDWARREGISEIASDALLTDAEGQAFHRALGFAETERVIGFRKVMAPGNQQDQDNRR